MDDVVKPQSAAALGGAGAGDDPAFDNAVKPAQRKPIRRPQDHPQPQLVCQGKADGGNGDERRIGGKRAHMPDPPHDPWRKPGACQHAGKIARSDHADFRRRKMLDSGAQRHQRCQQAIADNQEKHGGKHRQQCQDQNKHKITRSKRQETIDQPMRLSVALFVVRDQWPSPVVWASAP